jgi:hypothetical protein
MSQAEREAYSEFLVSPAGAALTRAGPATSDVVVHWMDEDDPDASNAMAAVAKRVLQELDSARVNPGKAQ